MGALHYHARPVGAMLRQEDTRGGCAAENKRSHPLKTVLQGFTHQYWTKKGLQTQSAANLRVRARMSEARTDAGDNIQTCCGSFLPGFSRASHQTEHTCACRGAVSAPTQLQSGVRRDSPGLEREMSTRFTLDFSIARLLAFVLGWSSRLLENPTEQTQRLGMLAPANGL